MSRKRRTITAYLLPGQHDKAEVLARISGASLSLYIARNIEDSWRRVFGEATPQDVAHIGQSNHRVELAGGRRRRVGQPQ